MMENCTSQNCSICLEPLTECPDAESQIHKNDCEHVFHGHCLSEWFRIGVPGNYCPLCRNLVEGMEEAELSLSSSENEETAEMSSSEDEEADEMSSSSQNQEAVDQTPPVSSLSSESEELLLVAQENQVQMTEEGHQSVMPYFLEVEQAYVGISSQLNVTRSHYGILQEYISGFVPPTTAEQEVLEMIRESVSEVQEGVNSILENIKKALEITANASESRDPIAIVQMGRDLDDIRDRVREQLLSLQQTFDSFERLPGWELAMNNTT